MRTADRVRAEGLSPHTHFGPHRLTPTMRDDLKRVGEKLVTALRGFCPVIVADNVHQYVVETYDETTTLDSYPSLAPPWPSFWIEYPNDTGRERRGIWVLDVTDAPRAPDGVRSDAVKDAMEQSGAAPEDVRWLIELTSVIEDARHRVLGPMGWFVFALDQNGRWLGNRWALSTPQGSRVIDGLKDAEGRDLPMEEWFLASVSTALQTIAFLHCRNMVVEDQIPPAKLVHRHRKQTGQELVRYKTLRLEVPRRRGVDRGGPGRASPAVHIVPGNFHHYGDCCPGVHPAHGKLFGRLEGVYFVPTHIRGNPERGVVLNEYEIDVNASTT